jgi:glutamate synthase domain-containing protein 3
MTGGTAFVFDADELLVAHLNDDLVVVVEATAADVRAVRELVERHERLTRSARARTLLAEWDAALATLRVVRPRVDVARVESEHEGHEVDAPAPAEARAQA